jgi:CBS domain containing-hemolysin-like protein
MGNALQILTVLFLILITAYFVVCEFSYVRIRTSRIEQLITEGNRKARNVKKIIDNLDGYLSASQLGISIASLGLGWLGEPTVQSVINPVLDKLKFTESVSHMISFIIAFSIVTFLSVVLGELAPKTIAIQKAEWIALNFAASLQLFHKVLFPAIWLLNGSSNLVVKLLGFKLASEVKEDHSEEEIKYIVSASNDINIDEKTMLEKIFDFDETIAREIMVHRKDMKCIYLKDSLEETMELVRKTPYSRFPVVGVDKDDVKGYITIRDLYNNIDEGKGLNGIIREIPMVYESMPIKKILSRLQKEKSQIAIVYDEYGGVAGMVTMEDIVEEIVGDIQDEFDNEINPIKKGKNRWMIDGEAYLEDVEDAIGHTFTDSKDTLTIGGYVLNHISSDQLKENSTIELDGISIDILKIEEGRIVLLSIPR